MSHYEQLSILLENKHLQSQTPDSHFTPFALYLIGRRSSDWLKIKVAHTADFEVIGCVPMRGEKAIRVLLLGEKHQGRLVYKGKVSSGLTRRQRQDFLAELTKAPKLQEPGSCKPTTPTFIIRQTKPKSIDNLR